MAGLRECDGERCVGDLAQLLLIALVPSAAMVGFLCVYTRIFIVAGSESNWSLC